MRLKVKLLNEYKNYDMSKEKWFEATELGNVELVRNYIENGFDINCINKNRNNRTALISASYNNHLDILLELLKQHDIDVNAQDEYERTALIWCSIFGSRINIATELLKHPNIDVNIMDFERTTALMWVCITNQVDLAKLLINHPNIKFNLKDKYGKTALDMVKRSQDSRTDILKLFKEVGVTE